MLIGNFLGCTGERSKMGGTVAGFSARDSAGIMILATAEATAHSPLGWRISSTPQIQIGERDAPGPYLFSDIRGVRILSDERIVVADGASREVRFFDSQGNFLTRLGRVGNGPGEFQTVELVPGFGDSVLVFDRANARFTVFIEGEFHSYVDRAIGRDLPVGSSGNLILVKQVADPRRELGISSQPIAFRWLDRTRGTEDTIAVLESKPNFGFNNDEGMMTNVEVPFTVSPSAAAGNQRDLAYVLDNAGLAVHSYSSADGHRIFRIDETDTPVTAEMRDRFLKSRLAHLSNPAQSSMLQRRLEYYEPIPTPEVAPAYQRLLVDELGWLWVELDRPYDETAAERAMRFSLWSALDYTPPPPSPPIWMIFDSEGKAHGTVEAPIGLDIHAIGTQSVVGVWRDELGLEYVRKYSLDR